MIAPRRARPYVAAAAAFVGLAAANHLLARRAEVRHPPKGRFVTVDGVRLHYLEAGAGAGPPIVLLHGNAATSEEQAASGLLDALAADRRVIAFDRPGYGYSERPRGRIWTAEAQAGLLLRALEKLDAQGALVVGHSWGALVAAHMGLDGQGALCGLVLIAGYYRPTPRLDGPLLGPAALPGVGEVMRYTISPVLGRIFSPLVLKTLFAPAPVSDRFRNGYPVSIALRPSQIRASSAEAGLIGVEAARLTARLSELTLPVLIIGGREDRLISFSHQSEWLAGRLPQAQLVPVEGAGHMVHHTASQEVIAAIERFHEGLEPHGAPASGPTPVWRAADIGSA